MDHLFYCFSFTWISFRWLYLSIIVRYEKCPAKVLLRFIIKSISWSKVLSTSLIKSKTKAVCLVIIASLFSQICTPIIIMTWLNCFKLFWRFYYTDAKDIIFAWFHSLFELFPAFICANNIGIQVYNLFGVICLVNKFLIFLHLAVTWMVTHLILLHVIFLWYPTIYTIFRSHIYQALNY